MSTDHTPGKVTAPVAVPLDMTDVARIWRKVYGGTRMDSSAAEFADALMREVMERTAAPDLLEALILMVRTHDEPAESLLQEMREQQWLEQARAAIAKATGGAL